MKHFHDLPAPAPLPILGWRGNALEFTNDPLNTMNALAQLGDVVALVQGGNEAILFPLDDCPGTVFVFGRAHNQFIMSQADRFHSGPIIGPIYGTWMNDADTAVLRRVGTGLFSLNGPVHQQHRRLMMPSFHRRHVELYADGIVRQTDEFLRDWQPGDTHDIQREMFNHTLTVAGAALFGQQFGAQAQHIGALIQEWLLLIPMVSIEPKADTQAHRRFIALCHEIDGIIRQIIAVKRQQPPSDDVLSELLNAREGDAMFSEDELIGHVNILLTAGHETTANAISWTLFLLSQHPDAMALLDEEISRVLGTAPPAPPDLDAMPMLDHVLKESLRICPPVTMGSRIVVEPTEMDGYLLPAGTEIVFSHYHAHHDPAQFPEPQRYRPERWETIQPSIYEYFPFSAGVRMCLGVSFATLEIKLVLVRLLQRFRFQMLDHTAINRHVYVPLRPNAMPMRLRERDGRYEESLAAVRGNVREMVDLPL